PYLTADVVLQRIGLGVGAISQSVQVGRVAIVVENEGTGGYHTFAYIGLGYVVGIVVGVLVELGQPCFAISALHGGYLAASLHQLFVDVIDANSANSSVQLKVKGEILVADRVDERPHPVWIGMTQQMRLAIVGENLSIPVVDDLAVWSAEKLVAIEVVH